uniref:Putative archaeal DNA coating protein n=1 Tax=viral metagenome TaxID=1070528 RepID=A0A6M3LWE4_9ZZZZ
MVYVTAVLTCIAEYDKVIIQARGQSINRAVDVAEIVRKKFLKDLRLQGITIDTETMRDDDGRPRGISTIDIELEKS